MKDYTIYASVKGCVAISVRADNLTDALKKSRTSHGRSRPGKPV